MHFNMAKFIWVLFLLSDMFVYQHVVETLFKEIWNNISFPIWVRTKYKVLKHLLKMLTWNTRGTHGVKHTHPEV